MTPLKETVEQLVERHAQKLRLNGWDFTVVVEPAIKREQEGEEGSSNDATIHWDIALNAATISISQASHDAKPENLEWTVIHELLHLLLEGHAECGNHISTLSYERALNILSYMLCEGE